MPAPPHPPPAPSSNHLGDDSTETTPFSAWLLIWTIVTAKLLTIALVLIASHSVETGALVAVTTSPWLAAAAFLLAGPLLFRYRLRRVRAKREHLRRAEWMTGGDGKTADGRTAGRRRTFQKG